MLKFAQIVILLAAAAPALAQTPATTSPEATRKSAIDPLDKIVCQVEEGIGSRLNRKKVCMSARAWKDQRQDSREQLEKLQQGSVVTRGG